MRRRNGIHLVEILLALLVVAGVLVPMISGGQQLHERSHFTERRMLALLRARTLLDLVSSIDFDALESVTGHGAAGTAEVLDLQKLFDPGELEQLTAAPPQNQEYRGKTRDFVEKVTWTPVSPGLAWIETRVTWSLPGDDPATPHGVTLGRLLHEPQVSFSDPRGRVP